jgi:hypothetical protein
VAKNRATEILPDRLDGADVFADHAWNDRLFQTGCDRFDAEPEQQQVAHADDAALGSTSSTKMLRASPKGMALEPGRLRPWHAQTHDISTVMASVSKTQMRLSNGLPHSI